LLKLFFPLPILLLSRHGSQDTKLTKGRKALTQKGFIMGFRINTNIAAMDAHRNSVNTNSSLDKSLQRLSSGLRINTAADDASGLAIANSLRSQSSGLGQAISNANDGIGVMQTADGALDEYENIINTVRTKSIQAASDGQNADSRKAIQSDIDKLLEEANNIATTTSFNGQKLLDGTFTNKSFHIGAYKDETVNISVSNVQTNTIGSHVNDVGDYSTSAGTVNSAATVSTTNGGTGAASTKAVALGGGFKINDIATGASVSNTSVAAGRTAGSAYAKAQAINSVESSTGVHATAETIATGSAAITAGTLDPNDSSKAQLVINGENIGTVTVLANDSDGALRNAINAVSDTTGVTASLDEGKLVLTSNEGREITIGTSTNDTTGDSDAIVHLGKDNGSGQMFYSGKLTLSSDKSVKVTEDSTGTAGYGTKSSDVTLSLGHAADTVDVTTRKGAEASILTMDAALKQIDSIRSNIGSTQNQLESTVRNISVTQVNVSAAESQIRDVDFAAESAEFSKQNILAQSGSYAMSQANAVQQNVMRLLQ